LCEKEKKSKVEKRSEVKRQKRNLINVGINKNWKKEEKKSDKQKEEKNQIRKKIEKNEPTRKDKKSKSKPFRFRPA